MTPRISISPTLIIITGLVASQALVAGVDFEVALRLDRIDQEAAIRADEGLPRTRLLVDEPAYPMREDSNGQRGTSWRERGSETPARPAAPSVPPAMPEDLPEILPGSPGPLDQQRLFARSP
ncbi:MAG: hypothetical protein AB7P21_25785 [Lautropia sp.]